MPHLFDPLAVGPIELPNRIVACVLTKENKDTRWIVDNEAQLTVARMGEAIVKAWRPPAATP